MGYKALGVCVWISMNRDRQLGSTIRGRVCAMVFLRDYQGWEFTGSTHSLQSNKRAESRVCGL